MSRLVGALEALRGGLDEVLYSAGYLTAFRVPGDVFLQELAEGNADVGFWQLRHVLIVPGAGTKARVLRLGMGVVIRYGASGVFSSAGCLRLAP